MRSIRLEWVCTTLVLSLFATGAAVGQVATVLLDEDDIIGPPGSSISSIGNPAANGVGGYTVGVVTTGAETLSHIWGSTDGIAPPAIIRTEGTFGVLVQEGFESFYGMSNTGQLGYSATGTGGPDGDFDSVWIDDSPFAVEGDSLPPGPYQDQFWSFASRPTITADGVIYFQGGTRATVGGSTNARGLFDNTGTPLLYTGEMVSGLPAPLDDSGSPVSVDYSVSSLGTNYLAEVEMETVGTGVSTTEDNAMVLSGAALMAGGSVVREGQPVPMAIGGLAGENWDNFDRTAVTESGQYMFTGDTDAATSSDEIVVVNGMIVAREGEMLDGLMISGAIESADMNENGDWAVVWDYDDVVDGNLEALFFNGELLIKELDDVDINGDGIVDAGNFISDFTGISTLVVADRAGGQASVYFTADVEVDGISTEAFMRIDVQVEAGDPGDLALSVTDIPDPVTTIGDSISYSVLVTNLSPANATNVVVTTTLDANVVFNPSSDPIAVHDGSPTGGVVTAAIGSMAPDELQSFTIVVDTTQEGTVTSTHVVSGDEPDPDTSNNSVVTDTEVAVSADLSVSIVDTRDPVVDPNGSISYMVETSNFGPSEATGVTVTMTLDGTTVFNAAMSDAVAVHDGSPMGGVITADLGNIPVGGDNTFLVVVDTTAQGLISATATAAGNEADPNSDNDSETEETLYELSADLSITMSDSPDPVVGLGGTITYMVDVMNSGPSDATAVVATINLDSSTTFVSADAPAMHAGGVVTADLGAMPAGSGAAFTIQVSADAAGRTTVTGEVTNNGEKSDADPLNNDTLVNTLVLDDASCVPTAVFTTLVESSTSAVPGIPGLTFTSFDRPYRSPDGSYWIISADTDGATSMDELIIVKQVGQPAAVVVQEGVTLLDLGDAVGPIDQNLSINDAGQYAFTTNTNGPSTSDETVVKWDGATFVTVAREGDPAAVDNYGTTLRSVNIVADGTVWFDADTTGGTDFDQLIVSDDGATIVLREGTDIPTGQDGGATAVWDSIDTGDLYVDATGANYAVTGDTGLADTDFDDVFAVNNDVKVQEGVIVPGSGYVSPADALSPVEFGRVESSGDWMARGGNDDDQDWVLRNGAVIAETGSPIATSSPENYDDDPFAACFFAFAANNNGDVVIAGTTSAGEDAANAVLVLNDTYVVARENDLIDVNGDGVLDDGVRIRTFGNEDLLLTDDLRLYFTVSLRAADDDGSNSDIGDAYVEYDLSCLFCGNGVLDAGEECDDGNNMDGDCCSASCTVESVGTVCRDAAGECDLPETCDGVNPTCPDDVLSTDECRAAAGDCDLAEFCDGVSVDCPADELSTDECRASTGSCDPAESCDGAGVDCPADVVIDVCISGDGCCAPGCNNNNDTDCPAICGNGIEEAGEGCDDGNTDSGDGCDAMCGIEASPVPTVSTWGLLVLALMLLVFAKLQRNRGHLVH